MTRITRMKYILSIDQGTSSTKAILFDEEGKCFARAAEPLQTKYLENGFVEQDPEEIFQNVLEAVKHCLEQYKSKGGQLDDIKTCGISNQRETFVIWDKKGKPLHQAIVWQCKRSIEICKRLKKTGYQEIIKSKTGLVIDPYFSGTKLMWLCENNDDIRHAVDAGNAYFGTVDTWLLYQLTHGGSYFTDYTNASRTLFFNLRQLDWDQELLKKFGLSSLNLPKAKTSSASFGQTDFEGLLTSPITINAMIGDSHAAAFGECCFTPGTAKATMGTGCSILMNIGDEPGVSNSSMVTTICWSTPEKVHYALEGVIVSCGSTLEWLKNELQLFSDSKETEVMATTVQDNGGVYLIPAFSGLGAPYWEMDRKATLTGLTFGTHKNHVVRAALESIPYQVKDVIAAMESDTGIELHQLMADGGVTSNRFVMQFLADLLQKPVVNIGIADVSALGAAYLAGLHTGIFKSLDQLTQLSNEKKVYEPSGQILEHSIEGWRNAINNH